MFDESLFDWTIVVWKIVYDNLQSKLSLTPKKFTVYNSLRSYSLKANRVISDTALSLKMRWQNAVIIFNLMTIIVKKNATENTQTIRNTFLNYV